MSKKYEITGTLKHIGDTQTFAKGFTKREFVIETQDDKYPQLVKLEVTKERCAELDDCEIGDTMEVQFDIRGNEYNGKYYVNLACWKLQGQGEEGAEPRAAQRGAPAARSAAPSRQSEPTAADLRNESDFDDDDVPF